MSEKKIDPKDPTKSVSLKAEKNPAEINRTSQRVAAKKVNRVAAKKIL